MATAKGAAEMYLTSLIYASRAKNIDEDALRVILAKARKNNERLDVTGVLVFNSNYFLQCLEGGRENVNFLYRTILCDDRHDDPEILDYRTIDCRRFEKWRMAYVGESVLRRDEILKCSVSSTFQPYSMSGEGARQLLASVGTLSESHP